MCIFSLTYMISGDEVPSNAPEKNQWLASFGSPPWNFATNVKGQTLFDIKTRGFLIIGLLYSPQVDLTAGNIFNQADLKPMKGIYGINQQTIPNLLPRRFTIPAANTNFGTVIKVSKTTEK